MLPTPIETATIGAIVAADYRTAQVFEARGIDFCCGGKIPLATVCARNGLNLEQLIHELEAVQNEPGNRGENYVLPLTLNGFVLSDYLDSVF